MGDLRLKAEGGESSVLPAGTLGGWGRHSQLAGSESWGSGRSRKTEQLVTLLLRRQRPY